MYFVKKFESFGYVQDYLNGKDGKNVTVRTRK